MNGVHDMGGMQNLGALAPEPGEPVFHEDWEARVFAMVIASPVRGNIDAGRFRREMIPGPAYLAMSYFERWFAGLCAGLLEAGVASAAELEAGAADPRAPKATPRLRPEAVAAALEASGSYRRDAASAPAFAAGERVRARNLDPPGHTRLPRYVRGREGVVERWHGAHVFPDVHAHGGGEDPRHLYTVRFEARELWGPGASERDSVRLDLWEPYLERP